MSSRRTLKLYKSVVIKILKYLHIFQPADANKNKLTTLSSDMTRIQSSWNSDYNYLNGKINTINTNLSLVYGIIDSNRATILHLESKLDATNAEISAANEKIAKLQNINKIWANNFRTVKKTFDELRRKVKFAVPSLKIVKAVGV